MTTLETLRQLAANVTQWDWSDNDWDCVRDVDRLRDYLNTLDAAPAAVQDAPPPREPDGYAWEYESHYGKCIRFSNGEEWNGSRPLRSIPYWLGEPPAPAVADAPRATPNELLADPKLGVGTAPQEDAPLLDRIDAAFERIRNGHAPMRIPTDMTDVDVLGNRCSMLTIHLREI